MKQGVVGREIRYRSVDQFDLKYTPRNRHLDCFFFLLGTEVLGLGKGFLGGAQHTPTQIFGEYPPCSFHLALFC